MFEKIKKNILVIIPVIVLLLVNTNIISACTGFTATKNGVTLVGNNNDWCDPDVYIKFYPAEEDKNGIMLFESKYPLPFLPTQYNKGTGINDQGLFYTKFNLNIWRIPVKSLFKKIYFPVFQLEKYCLEHCSTVDEVVEIFNEHNLMFMFPYQSFFVDKKGDSVIIEGDDMIYRKGDYQVVTNHLQTKHQDFDCWRYKKATSMLDNMTNLSIEFFKTVCNATHSEEPGFSTQDSFIYNLNTQEIYLYYSHQYDRHIKLNLTKEFKKEKHQYLLPSIFEPEKNNPPEKPVINIGNKSIFKYEFYVKTTDPNDDKIYYKWNFGDGKITDWIGPYSSNQSSKNTHRYILPGSYNIKVKARDIYGRESSWSEKLENNILLKDVCQIKITDLINRFL